MLHSLKVNVNHVDDETPHFQQMISAQSFSMGTNEKQKETLLRLEQQMDDKHVVVLRFGK